MRPTGPRPSEERSPEPVRTRLTERERRLVSRRDSALTRRRSDGTGPEPLSREGGGSGPSVSTTAGRPVAGAPVSSLRGRGGPDRKSTRLNSSHGYISYAVF